jgi:dTMP kinase
MHNAGRFITFEGGEGAGKSTLIAILYDLLKKKGVDVLKTREPGGSYIGQLIRNVLLERKEIPLGKRAELLLFLADRAQHVEEVILPAIQSGTLVLCDRFTDSTIAYQGIARGIHDDLELFCQFASFQLEPHRTFLLDIDPQIGLERVRKLRSQPLDRLEEEDLTFHQKVRNAFLQTAQRSPLRIIVLDGAKTPDQLAQEAMQWIPHSS